jgi:KaiC/GvpD/RAD55 family RecA-like ATPase
MTDGPALPEVPGVSRIATGVPGLDLVLGGGLPAGRTCLVAGPPGSGKTTLGNQLAFAHAAMGAYAVVATLLTETHDLLLANLASFQFLDAALVGERVSYLNLARQMITDPAIRQFAIGQHGISVGAPFSGATHLLTGSATPTQPPFADEMP